MAGQYSRTSEYGHQVTGTDRQRKTAEEGAPVAKKHGYHFWHDVVLPWVFIVGMIIFIVAEVIGCLVGHPFAVIGAFIVVIGAGLGIAAMIYYGITISIVVVAFLTIFYVIGKLF